MINTNVSLKFSRRRMLQLTAASGVMVAACGAPETAAEPVYDAIIGPDEFPGVNEAIADLPADNATPYRILVREGVWHQKVMIDKPNVHLIGESRTGSVLNFDAAQRDLDPDGNRYGLRCGSTQIYAPDCSVKNLTLRNSFDYNAARADRDNPAGNGIQALALTIGGEADRTLIQDVNLEGWQDTLFANHGRSLFLNCFIEGCVDFIFGAGTAYFQDCEILTLMRDVPSGGGREGYITAPNTAEAQTYGLVFSDCRLTKTDDLPKGSIALGRPWHNRVDAVGQATFLICWMDDHIDPDGWDRMAYGRNEDGTYKWFTPEDARFSEYKSSGPGAVGTEKRPQLNAEEAAEFTREKVLGDWAPDV